MTSFATRSAAMLRDDPATPDTNSKGKAPPLIIPMLSSQPTLAPAPRTPSSTVPRKLVDLLSPLLRGKRASSSGPPPSPATTPRPSLLTPSTPAQPAKRSTIPSPLHIPPNSDTPHPPAHSPLTLHHHHLSDIGSPSSPSPKTTPSINTPPPKAAAANPTQVPTSPSSPFASLTSQLDPGTPAPLPKAPGPNLLAADPQPMTVFPALGRLCTAARFCALPPSRSSPEPGTPNYPTELLALALTLPPRMARPNWCLADYAIIEKLYKGYASTVYKAFCKSSSDVVVLKVYTLAAVCDLYKYQIYREVRLHSRLQHENIIALHAAFQEGDKVVLVQEYADGADLFSVTQKYGGRLTERLAVQLVLDPFIRVMHYLHARGILHRDIKPENILFTRNMCLKLGDFGLAIDLEEEQPVTRAGTLDYMAPEVLRCPYKSSPDENKDQTQLHYSAGIDAWAVGVMTYELLVGSPPFYNQTRTKTEEQILTCSPGFPRGMTDEAMEFIGSALNKSVAQRLTLQQMLHHPWVEGYRSRRSVRAVGGAKAAPLPRVVSAGPCGGGGVAGTAAAGGQVGQAALPAAAAAPALPAALPSSLSLHPSCLSKALSKDKGVDGSVIVGARASGDWQTPSPKAQPVAVHRGVEAWLHST